MRARKPPIVAIRGNHVRDVVTQAELQRLAQMQDGVWLAEKAAQKFALELESRITHGAAVEDGALAFDGHRGMARTKKADTAKKTG